MKQGLRLFVWVLPFLVGSLAADYGIKPRITANYMIKKASDNESKDAHVLVSRKDTAVTFQGLLSEQYFKGESLLTLNKTLPDSYHYFRHRSDLIFHATHGKETYGKVAMEGLIDVAAYFNWRFEDLYTKVDPFGVFLDGSGGSGFWVQSNHKHTHDSRIPLIFMQEAWLKANFDALCPWLKNKAFFFQAGYFPYKIGRGISLGESAEGGVAYMGWSKPAASYTGGLVTSAPQATQLPPGFVFHGSVSDNVGWEIYFSKWVQRNSFPWTIDEALHSPIIDPRKAVGFGKGKDADQWATRLMINFEPQKNGKVYIEPYHVYLSSAQHSIEYLADSELYLNTGGIMVDLTQGGFNLNMEVAGQWGKQHMHALDRNFFRFKRNSTGGVETRATHILRLNSTTGEPFYDSNGRAYTLGALATDDVINSNLNNFKFRSSAQNGTELFDATPAAITQDIPTGSFDDQAHTIPAVAPAVAGVYHAPDWWLGEEAGDGGARFRKPYKVKLDGWMGLVDISYDFEKVPFKVATAAGYISGDAYPYEKEEDKTYHGFLPMRDTLYQGKAVQSLAIFGLRLMPRPLNINYKDIIAYNNIDDISNLSYFGLSGEWYPLKDKQKLVINSNLIFFAQNALLYKWDPKAINADALKEGQLKSQQAKIHFRDPDNNDALGWTSQERASNYLGTEWNVQLFYKLTDSCQLDFKAMIFVTGDLYKNLKGQPNQVTKMLLANDTIRYNSLGDDTAWFVTTGINYKF